MKTGLIMEGGAMRGMFTAGVMDVMMEHGIRFDGGCGVSAGAAFGCNYKSRQIGRVIRYNTEYCRNWRFCSFRSLILTGDLYGADFCYRKLPEELDLFDNKAYIENPMEFYLVCTDIETGEAVYKKIETADGEELEWMRASASMPLVSRIVEIGGLKMLDGGIADSVPLRYFESIGYERNIVVLTQPSGYVKKANSMMPLVKLTMKKYPKMIEAMERRHIVYNETLEYIAEREAAGAALVIRPDEALPMERLENDPDKLRAAYRVGREITLRRLDEIKAFVGEDHLE